MWISIVTEADARDLLTLFGGFHDSCVREAHMWTNHSVAVNLAMSVDSNLDTSMKFLVQRQFRNPSCIELQFEQVTRINIVPTPENYNSVIYNASLTVSKNGITWALDPETEIAKLDSTVDSWVTAKLLKYRVADELLESIKN